MNKQKTLTFLLPACTPRPGSGGYRTVLRSIDFLIKNGYIINIEMPINHKLLNSQHEKISRYNVISNTSLLNIVSHEQDTSADIYIATGWQTFTKAQYYLAKNKCVTFFCQDLEWKFPRVSKNDNLQKHVKNFYDIEIPTFTMSKFLGNYFNDQRILKSTSLNVDTDIYYNQSQKRDGVCLLYCDPKSKPHRLGELVLKLAKTLASKYPEKPISIYGSKNIPDIGFENVKYLNVLNNEQLASLYNTSELGVVFSTTNPSRIAYEMVACGMPAIEADCEYTKYDMGSDAFVRTDPVHDTVISKIESLLNDPKEMNRLRVECETYSKNNFRKLAEEKRFLDFIEEIYVNIENEKNNNYWLV